MSHPPVGFVQVGQHKYAEYAKLLGMSPAGRHLIVRGRTVGWRTNRHVYVDPAVYFALFGKDPFGYQGSSDARSHRPTLNDLLGNQPGSQNKARVCPTCRAANVEHSESGAFKCLSCATSFLY
jgi:hypothetical protein